jgi:putative FmdB family regulatory protein
MPTYEYKREDGTTFEIFQSMSDDALKTCPDTGQPVKRIISGGSGLVFKGTGFYVTDYKNNGSKNGAGKTSGSDSDAAKASSGKESGSGSDATSKD